VGADAFVRPASEASVSLENLGKDGTGGCPVLAFFARAGTMLPTARDFDLKGG